MATSKQVKRSRLNWLALTAAMTAITLAMAGPAAAQPVDLAIVDRDTGEVAPVWSHAGRQYIAGEPGHRYSLRVANHTDRRVLVVLSVDGVNVLDGETANYDQNGYVISPYGTTEVKGWRKSTTQVAAFTFASLSQSYAAQTGRPGDVGVIGMAVFSEYTPPPTRLYAPAPLSSLRSQSSKVSAPPPLAMPPPPPPPLAMAPTPATAGLASPPAAVARAAPQDEKLGTAHGAREHSVVTMVTFVRAASYPESVRQIEYDTQAHLIASGVIPVRSPLSHPPRAFPLRPDEAGFVPDPPGGS